MITGVCVGLLLLAAHFAGAGRRKAYAARRIQRENFAQQAADLTNRPIAYMGKTYQPRH